MVYIFLFYGLAFLAMGLILGVQARTSVTVLPARSLRFLVAFALLHGVTEWAQLVLTIHEAEPRADLIRTGDFVLTALSFAFLMQFGVEVLLSTKRRPAWLSGAAGVFLLILAVVLAGITLLGGISGQAWLDTAEAVTRYLLGFPASTIAAYALLMASSESRQRGARRVARNLSSAGAAFAVYAPLTGLVVPPAPFFPASWLNAETFLAVTRTPVELLRTICGVAISWFLSEALVVETTRMRLESERLRTEATEKLRDNEERLRLAVEAARMGVWFRDLNRDYLEWNTPCKRLFGLDPDLPVTLDRFYASLHPDDRERTQEAVQLVIATRGAYRNEYRAVWPDGSVHWLATLGRVFYDAAGHPERLFGVTHDITERKKAEQALAGEARHREEILAAERAARSEAEKVARLKDEFLATLSHELRTPLNAILGWANILRSRDRGADLAARGLESIKRNAGMLAQMVEDLLDVSRIVYGKLRLDLQPIDLREIVAEALTSTESSAKMKEIHLEAALYATNTVTSGDPTRLRQVVWNLLSNAIKFTPKGGRVRVTLHSNGDGARIEVSDTGQGIAPEFLPHVFEQFRQADASTTRRHGGLGLGLALVKHYAELHGGTVRADSEGEGRGATFTVTLPLRATDTDIAPSLDDTPGGAAIDLAGVKVLVVDDEADARELVQRVLSERKADVVTADSASAAIDTIQRFRPDVLVSDIGMPDEDGYQLIRALRALAPDQGGRTPAAALTAFARPEDRKRALDAGYQAHLTKPIDTKALLAAVARLAAQATASS